MKKYIFIAACVAVAGIMAGCSKENIEPETSHEMTGSEVQKPGNDVAVLTPHQVVKASSTATKTSLDGLQILWSKGDQLSLFNADGQTCTYTLTGDGGQTSGDFQTETMPEEGYRYAIYPAVPERQSLRPQLQKGSSPHRFPRHRHTTEAIFLSLIRWLQYHLTEKSIPS